MLYTDGYIFYVASVVARSDPAWAAQWGRRIRYLLRDVASPATDESFVAFRSHDWWLGHSSAGGTFNGEKNQESTSEAASAYNGCHLWGIATADAHVRDLCFALTASEIASSRRYWQLLRNDSTIGPPFSDQTVVGILWTHKASYTTWFSLASGGAHPSHSVPSHMRRV
jgi:endo-1,3(4)-beta-glucanase